MPLGLLSDDAFASELCNTPQGKVIDKPALGRNNKAETPESVRKIIADVAIDGASHEEIAKTFNVSESSVSAYKNGATSTTTYNEGDKELGKFVKNKKDTVIDSAHSKLIDALKSITPKKLEDAKVRDAASVARDMSAIIKNMTPEVEVKQDVQFVIFAPQIKKSDDDFDIIDVRNE